MRKIQDSPTSGFILPRMESSLNHKGGQQMANTFFAADIGYAELPYPAYRIDIWEADIEPDGTMKNLKNFTKSKDFHEEHASYSPDGKMIAFAANSFDTQYEKRMSDAWKRTVNASATS